MESAIASICDDVTGRKDGLPGFQVKSVDSTGEKLNEVKLESVKRIANCTTGAVLCSGARGKRFLGRDDREVDDSTVFWVASCTKIAVTIAVLQCVERELVTLDAVPVDVIPELKQLPLLERWDSDGTPIMGKPDDLPTIRQILSHQSGICVDISEPTVTRWLEYVKRETNSQTGNLVKLPRGPRRTCIDNITLG